MASRKGVADEQLKKLMEDRKHQSIADRSASATKRADSVSSYSSTSVSSISTNMSRSPSPNRLRDHQYSPSRKPRKAMGHTKRTSRRSSMSDSSDSSNVGNRARARIREDGMERSSRRPKSYDRVQRSGGHVHRSTFGSGRKRRRPEERSMSRSAESACSDRQRPNSTDEARRTRPRHAKASPDDRGRGNRWLGRKSGSRNDSMDRSQIARDRRSMTPDMAFGRGGHERAREGLGDVRQRNGSPLDDKDCYERSSRNSGPGNRRPSFPRKERSLSPFSKRLALTQAMNMGR